MFKRVAASLLALVLLSTPTNASEKPFFSEESGDWKVVGTSSTGKKNAACGAHFYFRDGSAFAIYSDLIDGELYVVLHNVVWVINDVPGETGSVRLNFHKGEAFASGGTALYSLIDKNTIALPNLNYEKFLGAFAVNDSLVLIMPGTVPNAKIPLAGSGGATKLLAQCIKAGGKQAPPKKLIDM